MTNTYQDTKAKHTILQHGISVWFKFKQLQHFLQGQEENYKHPIPQWALAHRKYLTSFLEQSLTQIKNYLIYHDCGKPFCLSIDEKGQHFANHAQVSAHTFSQYFNEQQITQLIADDMLCHITKPKDFESIINNPNIEILLCSALAELHSNALMFGGFDSDSFKIKFKNLTKLGNRILETKLNQGA